MVDAVKGNYAEALIQSWLEREWEESDAIYVRFSISILNDILNAGGQIRERDSKLFVSWPIWESAHGRQLAHYAMRSAREIRRLNEKELFALDNCFARELTGHELAEVMQDATFELKQVDGSHSSGALYSSAFTCALRFWTMPYRGRTGRSRRFVLEAKHHLLGRHPVIAGILELGDEAPFCRWRDDLLGLSYEAFRKWLYTNFKINAKAAATTLRALRSAVLPANLDINLGKAPADALLAQRGRLENLSKGRSKANTLNEEPDQLWHRKRISHALRLARGEHALLRMSEGESEHKLVSDVKAGVRGLHDVFLTRVHLEATILGAVPPFSNVLGGKLLCAFLSHPQVIRSPLASNSSLLSRSFDIEKLSELLPAHGMLCITTKGLYPGHASIYNRAELPGLKGQIRLKRLAETEGGTTSLISNRTSDIAKCVLSGTDRAISEVYGSGGSKRHRTLEEACKEVALPSSLVMAGIRRPVYGTQFLKNPEETIWAKKSPVWLVDPNCTSEAFNQVAVETWRQRWLERSQARAYQILVTSTLRDSLGDEFYG